MDKPYRKVSYTIMFMAEHFESDSGCNTMYSRPLKNVSISISIMNLQSLAQRTITIGLWQRALNMISVWRNG